MTKYKRTTVLLTLLAFILVCCKSHAPATKSAAATAASGKSAPPSLIPDGNDLTIAQSHWPNTSSITLSAGYALYNDKCVECHEAKLPQDFSENDWNDVLPGMGKKAHLDSAQYVSVYRYILTKRQTILSLKQ